GHPIKLRNSATPPFLDVVDVIAVMGKRRAPVAHLVAWWQDTDIGASGHVTNPDTFLVDLLNGVDDVLAIRRNRGIICLDRVGHRRHPYRSEWFARCTAREKQSVRNEDSGHHRECTDRRDYGPNNAPAAPRDQKRRSAICCSP